MDESINKNIADFTLVAQINAKIVGFVTLKLNSSGDGQIGLIAVDNDFQGKKLASKLIQACEKQIHAGRLLKVPTQEANLAAMKLYNRNNFTIVERIYIYHYWQ